MKTLNKLQELNTVWGQRPPRTGAELPGTGFDPGMAIAPLCSCPLASQMRPSGSSADAEAKQNPRVHTGCSGYRTESWRPPIPPGCSVLARPPIPEGRRVVPVPRSSASALVMDREAVLRSQLLTNWLL